MILLVLLLFQATFNDDQVMSLIRANEFTRAESALKASASANRSNARWHHTYGRLEFARQKPSDALPHFEKAAELQPRNAEYALWVGNAACNAAAGASIVRQPFLARSCKSAYDRTLQLDPSNVEARSSLIRYHMMAPSIMGGDQATAVTYANDLMRLAPYRGLQDRIFIATVKKESAEAGRLIREGIRLYPDSSAFRNQLGLLQVEAKDWAGAYEQFSTLARMFPDEWSYRYQVGRLAALSGQYLPEGRAEMEKLIRENPPAMSVSFRSMMHARYGQILAHQKQNDAARRAFDQALRIDPKNDVATSEKAKLR